MTMLASRAIPPATSWLRSSLIAALLLTPLASLRAQRDPQLGASSLADVIGAMTLQEKVRLLVGMGFSFDVPFLPAMDTVDTKVPEKVPGSSGRTHAIPRLGIPSLTLTDGPAGVRIAPVRDGSPGRTYYATAFPVATLLASSWDTAMVRAVGKAFGEEVREYGVDVLLAPGMNIHRNPLGGRNFEYYSEDPVLSGTIAAAFVDGVQSEGVGTSIKHFAANNQEFNRMKSNTLVSERALREIYLRGFEIAVRTSQPWTVMSSYNLINGVYASESHDLLTTILRDEWGFTGFVMTDWFGGNDPVEQVRAGNDVLMPGILRQTEGLLAAAASGVLSEAQLNTSVERVLRVVLRSPTFKRWTYSDRPDLTGHARIARRAAAEGMVLLRNEGRALPLASSGNLALFGNASYDPVVGGTGSGEVNEAYAISLDSALTATGYRIEASLREEYTSHIADEKARRPPPAMPFLPVPLVPELSLESSHIAELAGLADAAVITLGRNSGEMIDRVVEQDFTLSDTERGLIRNVSTAFHAAGKKVIVVLNVAGVIELSSWRDQADAILLAWQPGQEGGRAIGDVLRGEVNPSGRLPMTFPVKYEDVPSAENFPGTVLAGQGQQGGASLFGVPTEVTYDEGIYVGYRYYGSFGVAPAYPFGYGLSYTQFEYGDVRLSAAQFDREITATVTVANRGTVPGREVVQLYVSAPEGVLEKPESELRAFAKTGLLQPGQSETVRFTLTGRDLASFDPDRAAWVAEAGTYTVKVGGFVTAARKQATFDLSREAIVEQAHRALVPQAPIRERSRQQ